MPAWTGPLKVFLWTGSDAGWTFNFYTWTRNFGHRRSFRKKEVQPISARKKDVWPGPCLQEKIETRQGLWWKEWISGLDRTENNEGQARRVSWIKKNTNYARRSLWKHVNLLYFIKLYQLRKVYYYHSQFSVIGLPFIFLWQKDFSA